MSEFKNLPSGWSKCELGEICKISSSKFDPTKSNEVKKCIELEHLSQKTGQILGFISSGEQKSIKNEFKKGQILYGKLRPYLQKFCQAKFDGVCSSEIWVLQGKKVTNDFLFYLVQSDKFNQIANKTSGTKMPRADWEYMSEMPFFIPPELEQKKIAEILSTWDEAINLTINLIESKKQFKKALMQNLLTAKIRFPQFKDEWEEIRLGNIGKSYNGLIGKVAEDFQNGNSNFITYKNIFDNPKIDINIFEKVKIMEDEEQNLVKFGDIFFTTSSETPNEVGISSVLLSKCGILYLNSFCFGFRLNNFEILAPCFAVFYFRSDCFRKQIFKLAQGSTRFNISKTEVLNLNIKIPNLDEQQKIAEVLTACDDEINLLNLKLENLKKQKQGLMQKLLSGKVRVRV